MDGLATSFQKGISLLTFVEFESGEEFFAAEKEHPFTVVFLDIYMSGANGIEIAKKLRKTNSDCFLIFTTTSTDHALDGFRVTSTALSCKAIQ